MTSIFFLIALSCYVIVSIYFMRSLAVAASHLSGRKAITDVQTTPEKSYRINRKVSIILLIVGWVFHALTLYPYMMAADGNINFNLFNVLSLTALLMLGFSLLFSSYRPIIVLNVLAAPIAALGLMTGYVQQPLKHISTTSDISLTMQLHIILSIAAYSILFMAAMQAVLLLLQNRELKHKTHTRVWVKLLPPLQTMERLLFDMILVGFALLSVALGLGWLGVTDLLAQHLAHKTVFSGLAWLLFAWLIFGHWKFGWRGKRAANMTLWGFGLLALGFIGTKTVLELIL